MTEKDVEFEPGWLARQAEDASHALRLDHDRGFFGGWSSVDRDPFPLGWGGAEELARRMSERFRSWTGKSLEDHIAARAVQQERNADAKDR